MTCFQNSGRGVLGGSVLVTVLADDLEKRVFCSEQKNRQIETQSRRTGPSATDCWKVESCTNRRITSQIGARCSFPTHLLLITAGNQRMNQTGSSSA